MKQPQPPAGRSDSASSGRFQCSLGPPQTLLCEGIVWSDAQRLLKLRCRIVQFSLLRLQQPELIVGLYAVRFQVDGLLEISSRFRQITMQAKGIGQIEARHEIVGAKIQGFTKVRDGFIKVP